MDVKRSLFHKSKGIYRQVHKYGLSTCAGLSMIFSLRIRDLCLVRFTFLLWDRTHQIRSRYGKAPQKLYVWLSMIFLCALSNQFL